MIISILVGIVFFIAVIDISAILINRRHED